MKRVAKILTVLLALQALVSIFFLWLFSGFMGSDESDIDDYLIHILSIGIVVFYSILRRMPVLIKFPILWIIGVSLILTPSLAFVLVIAGLAQFDSPLIDPVYIKPLLWTGSIIASIFLVINYFQPPQQGQTKQR